MTISVVLADANILFSRTLRDDFVYAANEGAIEIRWSQQVLDEMSRDLRRRIGLSQADTKRLEELMNDYIAYALIEVNPDDLATTESVEMDGKDRHVPAAATSADADIPHSMVFPEPAGALRGPRVGHEILQLAGPNGVHESSRSNRAQRHRDYTAIKSGELEHPRRRRPSKLGRSPSVTADR